MNNKQDIYHEEIEIRIRKILDEHPYHVATATYVFDSFRDTHEVPVSKCDTLRKRINETLMAMKDAEVLEIRPKANAKINNTFQYKAKELISV